MKFQSTSLVLLEGKYRKLYQLCFTKIHSVAFKATVLLCKVLHDNTADENLVLLVDTLVEICEILYADSELRSPRSVLRLHNLTFIDGRLCVQLFYDPKAISKRKMFGKYFHSLITHPPILNRIISLRSLNAELQERVFSQANAISKATSNYHPGHIISNVIVRFQVEANREKQPITSAEQQCIEFGKSSSSFSEYSYSPSSS